MKKKIPKIVHQFWLGGEKIPELYERCIERNRGQLSTNGFEHFLYDDRNVSHILSWGKGDRFKRIYQAIPKREIACRKDFLATLVLHYKGGFALDCSMYIRSLASLSENYSHCLRYRHYMGKKARAACQYAIPCGFGFLGSKPGGSFSEDIINGIESFWLGSDNDRLVDRYTSGNFSPRNIRHGWMCQYYINEALHRLIRDAQHPTERLGVNISWDSFVIDIDCIQSAYAIKHLCLGRIVQSRFEELVARQP